MPWTVPRSRSPLLADLARTDAYLVWAQTTRFRDYVDATGKRARALPALVELMPDEPGGVTFDRAHAWLQEAEADGMLTVPPVYRTRRHLRHVTLTVLGLDPDTLRCEHVKRFEIGLPLRVPALPDRAGAAAAQPAPRQAAVTPTTGPGVVIGFVDDRCAFGHPAFLDDEHEPRLRALWDQGGRGQKPWTKPAGMGYGAELRRDTLSAKLKAFGERPRDLYRAVGMGSLLDGAQWHGTFGLDIAAGHPNPRGVPGAPRDGAARADLVFVQVPRAGFADVSGAWLCVHVLDGVHYILSQAGSDDRVVVNLSLGAFAGPHDGSSLLERALDELIASESGRLAVIVAAGNGREAEAHAVVVVPAKGKIELKWDLSKPDPTPSFLELWYSGSALSARVRPAAYPEPPSEQGQVGPCHAAAWRSPAARAGKVGVGVVHAAQTANGAGHLILVTVAATTGTASEPVPLAHPGVYTIELQNDSAEPVTVRGWIERDDPSPLDGSSPRWQSCLAPPHCVKTQDTMSSLACGRQTIVVGSCYAADHSIAPYSGEGADAAAPTGRRPDVCAPGQIAREQVYVAAGPIPDQPQRLWGTSVAAAVVTRQVANAFAGPRPAASIDALRKRLKQTFRGTP